VCMCVCCEFICVCVLWVHLCVCVNACVRMWQCACKLALQCFVGLESPTSPIFTSLRETQQRTFWLSQLVLVASADSWWFGGGLAGSAGSCHCCWLMFGILTLLNWIAGILTKGDWNHPQRTTSKQVHIPLSYLPFLLPYLWKVG